VSKLFFYLNLLFAFTVSLVRAEIDVDDDADFEAPSSSNLDLPEAPILSSLQFTAPSYEAIIPENSVGKAYVVPVNSRMGIQCNDSSVSLRFRIKSGDQDNFFKAESERVGDFVFLMIRTRTNNLDVLNRERRSSYRLDIRARARGGPDQRKVRTPEAKTIVNVEVTDSNDLDPFFQPSTYFFDVPEDTALHSTFGTVRADDADAGINGEIYFSLVDSSGEDKQFAVDPVTGGLSLTRPLSFKDRPRHELMVMAQDRGPKSKFATRAPDTATVHINVVQVRTRDV
jgi:protocadherin Fat 1/2/3